MTRSCTGIQPCHTRGGAVIYQFHQMQEAPRREGARQNTVPTPAAYSRRAAQHTTQPADEISEALKK